MDIKCNFCGCNSISVVYKARHEVTRIDDLFSVSSNLVGTLNIYKCNKCLLVFCVPPINEKELLHYVSCGDISDYISQEKHRIENSKNNYLKIKKYFNQPGKALDIGTGSGAFVYFAKKNGWDANGLEPNKYLVEYSKSKYDLNLENSVLSIFEGINGSYDMITFWDSLEHTLDPSSSLEKACELLKPGGLLIINYPSFDSVYRRIFKSRWWYFIPVHFYFFTKKVLAKKIKEYDCELLEEINYYQKLELSHIIKQGSNIFPSFIRSNIGLITKLKILKFNIKYYAGQKLFVARKKYN